MSFGFSIGDFITVSSLAWQVYKSCKDSSDDFKTIANDVVSLHIVLKEIEEQYKEQTLERNQQVHLAKLTQNTRNVLKDLEALLEKYDSLGTQSQRTWDRMRWGLEDINKLKERLTSSTTMLSIFNSSLISSSQARVEKKLNQLLMEMRTGKRERSVVSVQSIESLSTNDKSAWKQMRKELEDVGIPTSLFLQHRNFIVCWFRTAIAKGDFQEDADQLDNLSTQSWDAPLDYSSSHESTYIESSTDLDSTIAEDTYSYSHGLGLRRRLRPWQGSKLESGVFLDSNDAQPSVTTSKNSPSENGIGTTMHHSNPQNNAIKQPSNFSYKEVGVAGQASLTTSQQSLTPVRSISSNTSPALKRSVSSLLGNPREQQKLYSNEAVAVEINESIVEAFREPIRQFWLPEYTPILEQVNKTTSHQEMHSLITENKSSVLRVADSTKSTDRDSNLPTTSTSFAPYSRESLSHIIAPIHTSKLKATGSTTVTKETDIDPPRHTVIKSAEKTANIQDLFACPYFAKTTYFSTNIKSGELHEVLQTSASFENYHVRASQSFQVISSDLYNISENIPLRYRMCLCFRRTSGKKSCQAVVDCKELVTLQELKTLLSERLSMIHREITVKFNDVIYGENSTRILVPIRKENDSPYWRKSQGASSLLFFLIVFEAKRVLDLDFFPCRSESYYHNNDYYPRVGYYRSNTYYPDASGRDALHNTPLHIAASLDSKIPNCIPIVEVLIQRRADLTLRNVFGKTPWDVAVDHANWTMAGLLEISDPETFVHHDSL